MHLDSRKNIDAGAARGETSAPAGIRFPDAADEADEADVRYGLTARGEALVGERTGSRFRGFGPCETA